MYFLRVSFFTTLDIYKAYFKSCHTWIQRLRDLFFLCEKLLRLYVIGFCNQVLVDLHCYEVKNFAATTSFKVARVNHVLGSVQRVSHRLEICAPRERRLLQDQVQLGIEEKV